MKPEQRFERNLQKLFEYQGCFYIKIPDTKMINRRNRKNHWEQKRPFDGILVTKYGNFAIECKYQYNKLESHQREYLRAIHLKNGKAFVFRKRELKANTYYTAENYRGQKFIETDNLRDFIKSFLIFAKNLNIPRLCVVCDSFDPDNKTSSATKCKCGREKWEHPKSHD